jgi:hypothetical protein
MPDKTKIVVVIESHEQTIIRRSRRVSSQLLTQEGESQMSVRAPAATGLPAGRGRRWLSARCLALTLKGFTVFGPWSRRFKRGGSERRRQP